ncbi:MULTISPECIES: ABC transporter transmembrane domain-containing protein [Paenibacillus]|uniref:Multidrug ABC transporter permease/ATP-binding protein n=1 Tax=Paenibacillus odorifer TaxID=189426 RepID=A0A1R0WRQ7_9BACL|nr:MULTISPECIES: ABC transporter transmembrane domain-containing protein [Paenibacillus]ETT46315.1 multidrug resistance-like ATP-binding protein mdlA [Paenibacillus sp. FSL H8-237]MEC0133436.1 ABC transporter transmembrane domain-containing protein [Paenibacillus odorifer]MEC0221320.1 ABC transporter transmembrane domain-containing protein [Paenibacillus odorifer]OMD03028.1 multidrug ABC transporter permease/ATP-binding protein [Paenibacillus odorifer]OMD19886.1 multidrug ABC transporter perme
MFSVLRDLGWFFRREKRRYLIGLILLIGVGVLELLPPRLLGNAIDDIVRGSITTASLAKYIGMIFILLLVIYWITYIWMHKLFGGSNLVERLLRSRFMNHLMTMTPSFFEKNRTGDLMARATNDIRAVSATVGFGMLTLVDSTIYLTVVLFAMGFLVSWKLTLAAVLPLPLIAIAMIFYGKAIHDRYSLAQDAFGDMNDQVLESVSGVRVIRAYVQERLDEKRFSDITEDVYNKNMAVARVDAFFEPTIRFCVGLSYIIGLTYGIYLVFRNQITLGDLVSFNMYLGMIVWPMFAIGELINIMQRGGASLERIDETLNSKPDVQNAAHPVQVPHPTRIELNDVTFRYPSSTIDNLSHVNLTLNQGQTLGVVGRTGSGKSTLLKQLLREYPTGNGEILISGVPIQQISLDQLHSWMGYVPQEQILFSKSVRQNIQFGLDNADDDTIMQAITAAAFQNDLGTLSDGLDTLVGERGVSLSGGQKQRVSLSRAFIANPDILILDDALSAVDARTEAQIIDNIRNERAGKTTLISTHRLSAVQHADMIVVLDNGQIVERGTHQELLDLNGWYREQYDRQQVENNLSND